MYGERNAPSHCTEDRKWARAPRHKLWSSNRQHPTCGRAVVRRATSERVQLSCRPDAHASGLRSQSTAYAAAYWQPQHEPTPTQQWGSVPCVLTFVGLTNPALQPEVARYFLPLSRKFGEPPAEGRPELSLTAKGRHSPENGGDAVPSDRASVLSISCIA